MITLKNCPVCDSKTIVKYQQFGTSPQVRHEIMPGVKVNAAIITTYSGCQSCHVIFQNPRMSDRNLNEFYEKGYYRKLVNLSDGEKDSDEKHRAGVDAEIIKQYIGRIKSHLDVGCSRGFFLESVGAEVQVGVESDVENVRGKNIEVYSQLKEVKRKSFDLVTAIHTLEHVPSPVSFLKNMARFVAKDGYLVIEVPTWKSPGGPLRLPHLFHFEPDVLKLMCKSIGLQVMQVKFTPHLFLISKAIKN